MGGITAVLAASVAIVSVGYAPAHADSTSQRCGLAILISVRGTNEAAGVGTSNSGRTYLSGGAGATLNNLVGYANREQNFPVYQESINYPAVALDFSNPQATNYISSLQYGTTNLVGEINNIIAACPYTNILLAGYSQGADVIDQAIGAYHNSSVAVPPLTASAMTHIASVMLFGDPSYRAGEAWGAVGNGTGNGVFAKPAGQFQNAKKLTWLAPSYTKLGYVTTVRSYCFTGDFFCQSTPTPAGVMVHASYGASNAIVDAWVFTKNALTNFN